MAWTKRFNSRNKKLIVASINPSDEEYDELRNLDVHPASFDKAPVKRMRNLGIPHTDLVDASKQFIPMEDYEEARLKHPNSHLAATEEAMNYQDFYNDHMKNNAEFIAQNPEYNKTEGITLTPENPRGILGKIVLHHLALKNAPRFDLNFGDGYHFDDTSNKYPVDFPDRRRGNEWMLHECSKLDPVFNEAKKSDQYDGNWVIQSPEEYNKNIRQLGAHHMKEMINARTIPAYYRAKRALKSIDHISIGQFSPYDYSPEMYEED